MLGRIAEWKGQHVFVKAAERVCRNDDRTEFVIAGGTTTAADAAYERRLRGWIESQGLSRRIVLAGVVRDVVGLLECADVLVHCSISPEPFGQVIVEGMAAGVPVVATDKGGPAEIIEDGVTGRLYPPGDDQALAAILQQLLEDPRARQKLGAGGARVAAERFAIERTTAKVAEIYRVYAAVRGSAASPAPVSTASFSES